MNKKGFTLIEILIVISLLAIITTSSFIAFRSVNENSKNNDYTRIVEEFKTTAEVYVDKNEELRKNIYNKEINYYDVTLNMLLKDGLIENDIVNPKTNKKFNYDSYIRISYNNGLKKEFILVK